MSKTFDLVFEGGGAKGIAFVGALRAFEEKQFKPNRLLGTSAGAITATLYAAGYRNEEMLQALDEKVDGVSVFETFLEPPPPLSPDLLQDGAFAKLLHEIDIPNIPDFIKKGMDQWIMQGIQSRNEGRQLLSFVELGGIFAADKFLDWLRRYLDGGTFQGEPRAFSNMTFKEFNAKTGADLTLVAADVSASRLLYLNHRTTPKCPVVYAVRMSMSVPFVWPEVIWKKDWGTYQLGDQKIDLTGHAVVDGGLLSNFPIELLISNDKHVIEVMGSKSALGNPQDQVIGFLIDESLPVPVTDELPFEDIITIIKESNTVNRLMGLVNAATQAHDKMVIEAFKDCVVRLPAKNYGTLEFDMDENKRQDLMEAAYKATAVHIHHVIGQEGIPDERTADFELADEHARKLLTW